MRGFWGINTTFEVISVHSAPQAIGFVPLKDPHLWGASQRSEQTTQERQSQTRLIAATGSAMQERGKTRSREIPSPFCQVRSATKLAAAHIPHKPHASKRSSGKAFATCGKARVPNPAGKLDKPCLWHRVSKDQVKNENSEVLRTADSLQLSVSLASDCCAVLRRVSGPSGWSAWG